MRAGKFAANGLILFLLGCSSTQKSRLISKDRDWSKATAGKGVSFTHAVSFSLLSPYLLPHEEDIAWIDITPALSRGRMRILLPQIPDVSCFLDGNEGSPVGENLLEFFPGEGAPVKCRIRLGSTTLHRQLPVTYEVLLAPLTPNDLEKESLPRLKKTLARLEKLNVMDVHQLQQIPLDVLEGYRKRLWLDGKTNYLAGSNKGDYLVFLKAGGKFQISPETGKVFGAKGLGRRVPGLQGELPHPSADAFSLGCYGAEMGEIYSAAQEFKTLVRLRENSVECGLNLTQGPGRSWIFLDHLHIPPEALKEELTSIVEKNKGGLFEWVPEWKERQRRVFVAALDRKAEETRRIHAVLEPQIRELNLLLETASSSEDRLMKARRFYKILEARSERDQSPGEVEKRNILRQNYLRKLAPLLPETLSFEARLTGLNLTIKPFDLLGRLAYVIHTVKGEFDFKGTGRLEGSYKLDGVAVGDIFVTKRNFNPKASVIRHRFCPVSFFTRGALPSALRSLRGSVLEDGEVIHRSLGSFGVKPEHTCTPVVLKGLAGTAERFEAFDQCYRVKEAKDGWELVPWRVKVRYSTERTSVELKAVISGGNHVSSSPLKVKGETFVPGDEYCASIDELELR